MATETVFGLIGRTLGHSFSKKYFTEKFEREQLSGFRYELFELKEISELPHLLEREPKLRGLNVTVPYKEAVLPFLDELDARAAAAGAVNTIKIEGGKLKGYNTDIIGFGKSLNEFYPAKGGGNALVLGTGGAAKAVAVALRELGLPFRFVSRTEKPGCLRYADLYPELLQQYDLIVNTTPCGMYPDTAAFPPLPYEALCPQHYLFDLIYNPEETLFLKFGREAGAQTKNGLQMLHLQADAAWEIWQQA